MKFFPINLLSILSSLFPSFLPHRSPVGSTAEAKQASYWKVIRDNIGSLGCGFPNGSASEIALFIISNVVRSESFLPRTSEICRSHSISCSYRAWLSTVSRAIVQMEQENFSQRNISLMKINDGISYAYLHALNWTGKERNQVDSAEIFECWSWNFAFNFIELFCNFCWREFWMRCRKHFSYYWQLSIIILGGKEFSLDT